MQSGITRQRVEESGRSKRRYKEEEQGSLGSTTKVKFESGQGSGTLAKGALNSHFGVVPEFPRLPALAPCPKSGHLGYQKKEEIKGLQKNLDFAESKTGQNPGTLDESCSPGDLWDFPHGRLDAKEINSTTS